MRLHFYDVSPEDQKQLQSALGEEVATFTPDQLTLATADAAAEVVSVFVSSQVTTELLDKLPQLKLIACRSTGVDNVDLATAKSRHIAVTSVPTYGEHTVAEYTFGLLLSLTRKLNLAQQALKKGEADHSSLQGVDLFGKTLGIVGAGKIGRNVAAIARGFGMEILAYDPFPNADFAAQIGFTYTALSDVLQKSDFISLHVPYTPDNRHLIDAAQLTKLKPSAFLVNTSRGEVIDTKALVEALQDKQLSGAALDVFEGEKLVDIDEELHQLRAHQVDVEMLEQDVELSILQKMPNVIMTDHNAYNTVEAVERINGTTVDNIRKFVSGQPQNLV